MNDLENAFESLLYEMNSVVHNDEYLKESMDYDSDNTIFESTLYRYTYNKTSIGVLSI